MAEPNWSDVPPEYATGPNSYEIVREGTRVRMWLPNSRNFVRQMSSQSFGETARRAQMLMANAPMENAGRFYTDLASSQWDDEQILRYAHMRRQATQDQSLAFRSWQMFQKPFEGLLWLLDRPHQAANELVQGMLGDSTATTEGMVSLILNGDSFNRYLFNERGKRSMAETVAREVPQDGFEGAVAKGNLLIGAIVGDPLTYIGIPAQIWQASKVIRAAEEIPAFGAGRISAMLGARLHAENVSAILRARPEEIADGIRTAYKTGQWSDFIRARLGTSRKLVDDVAFNRGLGHLQGLLSHAFTTNQLAYLDDRMQAARVAVAGASGEAQVAHLRGAAVDAISNLYDYRKFDETQEIMRKAAEANKLRVAEIEDLDRRFGAFFEEKLRPGESHLPGGGPSLPVPVGVGGGMGLRAAGIRMVEAKAENEVLATMVQDLDIQKSVFGTARSLVKSRSSQRAWDWWSRRGLTAEEFVDPSLSIRSEVLRRARLGGGAVAPTPIRFLENMSMMTAHNILRVDEPYWGEQVRRMVQEIEKSSAHAGTPLLRDDAEKMLERILNAPHPEALGSMIESEIRATYQRLGVTEDQMAALMRDYSKGMRPPSVFALDPQTGKRIKTPVFSSQVQNDVGLYDMRLLRKVAKYRRRGIPLDGVARASVIAEMNSLWRQVAALRPAYAARVVFLSESMRNMLAGQANPISHPFVLLASTFERPGDAVLKLFRKFGVSAPRTLEGVPTAPMGLVEDALRISEKDISLGSARISSSKRLEKVTWGGKTVLADLKHPDEKALFETAWLGFLNRQVAHDPVALLFWSEGRGVNEALGWLKTDEGARWARHVNLEPEKPFFYDRARKYLSKQREVFNDVTGNSPAVWSRLGKLTADDLANVKPPAALPYVATMNTFANPKWVGTTQMVDATLGWMWRWMAEKPSTALSRRGPFRVETAREMARLTALANEAGVPADYRTIWRAATGETGVELSSAERQILGASRTHAERAVKQAVYDLNESARVADMARYIFPFANAFQEELTRWFMLAYSRPGTASMVQSLAKWATNDPDFTWEDPKTGKKILMLPFGDRITQFATGSGWNPITKARDGLKWPVKLPWGNVFILTAGGILPGFGPWVQIPAEMADRMGRRDHNLIPDFLRPYGGQGLGHAIFPSAFWRAWNQMDEKEQSTRWARKFRDVLIWHLGKTDGDLGQADFRKMRDQVTALNALDAAATLGLGGGAKPGLPPKIQELVDFYREIGREVPEAVDRVMLEAKGEQMAVAVQALTKRRQGLFPWFHGDPVTKEASEYLLDPENRALADRYGDTFHLLMSDVAGETFDHEAYVRQVHTGAREVLRGDQMYEAAMLKMAWSRWSMAKLEADKMMQARGLVNLNQEGAKDIADGLALVKEKLYATYPGFAVDHRSFETRQAVREQKIRDLFSLLSEPSVAGLPQAGPVRSYFQYRAFVRQQMILADFKTLNSQEAAPLARLWNVLMSRLITSHPEISSTFGRLLSKDNLEFDVGGV